MIIDDDHMDHLLFSEKGIPHAYVPDHAVEMAFLGSNTAGDWAVGDFWGPLGNETRAWLDYLATGEPTVHTTPARGAHQSRNHDRDRARRRDRQAGAPAARRVTGSPARGAGRGERAADMTSGGPVL